jgi:hypothetical protein
MELREINTHQEGRKPRGINQIKCISLRRACQSDQSLGGGLKTVKVAIFLARMHKGESREVI